MYASRNFKTKKAFREAVQNGEKITLYAAGYGRPNDNGTETVCGPHYPEPHKWYASVTVKDGIVTSVK